MRQQRGRFSVRRDSRTLAQLYANLTFYTPSNVCSIFKQLGLSIDVTTDNPFLGGGASGALAMALALHPPHRGGKALKSWGYRKHPGGMLFYPHHVHSGFFLSR
jgi:hypothetical protein